jgi:hypothetical protein
MPTRDIPSQEWQEFLDMFSRQHDGWRGTMAILGVDVAGLGVEARQMPLVGVTLEHHDGNQTIALILRGPNPEHLTHIIARPKRLQLNETEEGAHEALVIESADGTKTILRFRSAMLPEMVDDIAS